MIDRIHNSSNNNTIIVHKFYDNRDKYPTEYLYLLADIDHYLTNEEITLSWFKCSNKLGESVMHFMVYTKLGKIYHTRDS